MCWICDDLGPICPHIQAELEHKEATTANEPEDYVNHLWDLWVKLGSKNVALTWEVPAEVTEGQRGRAGPLPRSPIPGWFGPPL